LLLLLLVVVVVVVVLLLLLLLLLLLFLLDRRYLCYIFIYGPLLICLLVGVYMAGFVVFNIWAKGEQIDFDELERQRLSQQHDARATDFMSV
jgi:hypothetical protein